MNIKLNVSTVAREIVFGSRPRMPQDGLVTYKEMKDYVAIELSKAFGKYIHGLEYGKFDYKFERIYRSNGREFKLIAVPDRIFPNMIIEEKTTFNTFKKKDEVGEIQLQLEGYVCNAKLGLLKVRHINNNTISSHVILLDQITANALVQRYMDQTLLPYLTQVS